MSTSNEYPITVTTRVDGGLAGVPGRIRGIEEETGCAIVDFNEGSSICAPFSELRATTPYECTPRESEIHIDLAHQLFQDASVAQIIHSAKD